jgi:tetratricopeptide (TPR) repeat protein
MVSMLRVVPLVLAVDVLLVAASRLAPGSPTWDLDREGNAPAWWSGAQLLLIAVAAWRAGRGERAAGLRPLRRVGAWDAAAAFFLWLALDETLAIHEWVLREEVRALFPPDSLWRALFPWQMLFGPLLAVAAAGLVALFLTRLAALPAALLAALAGLGAWAAALLAEALVRPVFAPRGWYRMEVTVEEGLELAGGALLFTAVAAYGDAVRRGILPPVLDARARLRRAVTGAGGVVAVCGVLAAVVAVASLRNAGWLHRYNAADLARRGLWTEAVAAYERALAHHPDDPRAWYGEARALRHLGRQAEAKRCYRRAVALAAQLPAGSASSPFPGTWFISRRTPSGSSKSTE